ncbi:T9SS type A sorting domain-containing protein [Pedobacter sp. BS3]|uniref:T9SS type A sorting domain-containing protein n=1 Tax=Pedobacter sp. BS3 TaxID=2567937 RepID=UPI0011EDD14F|nr:T9SS type A sorting domain-containing protein [Pedobacter sp. BS3]TZF83641.1 T9SS type A sorting domain-containing protein [Pedobacter sp. BS3]
MNKVLLSLIIICLLTSSCFYAMAQTAASATWALTANHNAIVTGNITASAGQLEGLNHYDYISGGERTIPPGNSWPAQTAPDSTRFLQYRVAPVNGNNLLVDEIKIALSFNSSGAARANLSWSTDSVHFTSITPDFWLTSSSTPTEYTFSDLNITVQSGKTLYFRISPYTTGVINSRYLVTKGITISGTTTTAPVANWQLTANQQVTTSGDITAGAQTVTGLSVYSYISGNKGQQVTDGTGTWPAETGPNSNRYLQYTVSPTSGKALTVTDISLYLSFNSSSAARAQLAYSTDGIHFEQLGAPVTLSSGTDATLLTRSDLDIDVPEGKTLYLRVFPWTTASISGKYLVSKNVTVSGYARSVPVATWALTANQSATVSGNIAATDQALTGLTVNNYIPGNGGQRLLPSGGIWPAETGPNNSRYVLYTVSPVAGNNFTVNQITVPLSFNSSGYGHVRISWSLDNVSYTNLVADQPLASGSVPHSYTFDNLNIEIPTGKTLYLKVSPWTGALISDGRYLVSRNVVISGLTEPFRQVAFPGAEGGGRFAKGGRGGSVYYVTNLNDSGPGSLRDAVSQPFRTVLFKVSGTIELQSRINIIKDNITIAGQTAPGDGICLKKWGIAIKANNIIIRYIRLRPGDPAHTDLDAMGNGFGVPLTHPYSNIIIDHCSLSWSTDEIGSFYAVSDFTLQWSLLSESLYYSYHHKTTGGDHTGHGYGGIWGGQNASFHHNLLASNTNRNPRFSGSLATMQPELEYVDFRNNVIYNWGGSSYGGEGGHINMVNNYYKPGPATTGSAFCTIGNHRHRILSYTTYSINTSGDTVRGGKFYIKGNYVPGYSCVTEASDTDDNNWTYGVYPDANGTSQDVINARVDTPFPYTPVTTQTAENAYLLVTDSAGAILPRRDTLDRRIIRETRTGTATYADTSYHPAGISNPSGIIDSQETVGGWPALNSTTYPNDSDNDGMPDWWEAKINGGGTDSTSVNATSYADDGYTMLEKYLNAIPSPDKPVTFEQINGTHLSGDAVSVDFTIDWAKDQFKFALYRSTDDSTFTKITEIFPDINKTRYVITDLSAPAGLVYYKVGSYRSDGSGNTVYSDVITVNTDDLLVLNLVADSSKNATAVKNQADVKKLVVYPNPVNSLLTVNHSNANASAEIIIYTRDGKQLYRQTLQQGVTQTQVGTASLASGVYILELNNVTAKQQIMFVKR